MSIFIETLIYIMSISGIFFIFFTLADDNIDIIKYGKRKGKKIIDIYTYNIDNDELKVITNSLEDKREICEVVDIVNIYQKFDK